MLWSSKINEITWIYLNIILGGKSKYQKTIKFRIMIICRDKEGNEIRKKDIGRYELLVMSS